MSPNGVLTKQDFLGFTYNGVHSSELGIIRVSDGDRYIDNILPTIKDTTQPAAGHDGVYLISSQVGSREFSVNFAFDHLTDSLLNKLKQVFNGLQQYELIFDEYPYKVYDAKVKNPITLKYIPFDEEIAVGDKVVKQTIYKGEGSVNFICCYPYAHTPTVTKTIICDGIEKTIDGKYKEYYEDCNNIDQWISSSGIYSYAQSYNKIGYINQGDKPAHFILEIDGLITMSDHLLKPMFNGETEYYYLERWNIYILENCMNLKWDSRTGIITGEINENGQIIRRPIKYEGNAIQSIPVTTNMDQIPSNANPLLMEYTYSYWYC